MAEFVDIGDTVEGNRCKVYTRKEDFKGLRKDPITEKTMIVYELSRNCSVEVCESIPATEKGNELRIKNNIHGEIGDKIKANSITLYIDTKRQIRIETKEGTTSRHGGHLFSTSKRTVGSIKYPFSNLCNKFELSNGNISISNILND